MSEFHVEVVQLGEIEKHPNADSLGLTEVYGYPVIIRFGEYNEGDLAVYVPVDAVVPENDPRWDFLGGKRRIKAKKLRGVFSMGLLTSIETGMQLGEDVRERMRIEKYEETFHAPKGVNRTKTLNTEQDEPDPGFIPCYTDIEGLRRWKNVLVEGEEVICTEKVHGENARYCHNGTRLWVGSRTRIKKPGVGWWWRIAEDLDLATRLSAYPDHVFYGETHGYTGGFPYGTTGSGALRIFDVFVNGAYLPLDEATRIVESTGLEMVPVLYRGPWDPATATQLADGQSTLDQTHIREGIVVRPVVERFHRGLGRVILKQHSEAFLLR